VGVLPAARPFVTDPTPGRYLRRPLAVGELDERSRNHDERSRNWRRGRQESSEMGSRRSLAKSILAPTDTVGGFFKRRSVTDLAAKVGARSDWLRFARQVDPQPYPGLQRLGNRYGGYVVPLDLIDEGWICYSGGLGEDISFESVSYVTATVDGNDRFTFLPVGLWSTDSTVEFFVPANAGHVSHSILNLQKTNDSITATCRSLQSLMRELGHHRIDLLKLDVEGAEYEVLEPVFAGDLSCRVLCIDFHKVTSLDHMVVSVNRLRNAGYIPVHVYRTDVTFVQEPHHVGPS
jgi:FkbM family methyltransferase